MKTLKQHIIIFLLAMASTLSFAQGEDKGYRFDGNYVVFTFNKFDYEKFSEDDSDIKIKFEDLTIDNVVVAGEFNNWSKYGWKMEKVNNTTYELRKHINNFRDEFTWEFKFVVNNKYWAEPSEFDANVELAKKKGTHLNVYNLRMSTKAAIPDEKGNVRFRLRGYEDARKVIVAGSFNRWDEHEFKMYKTKDGWELKLEIKPGEYEYKFIVDGNWMEDPSNPSKALNEFGQFNSLINVGKYVTFLLKGHPNAERVILSGSFNDWNESAVRMEHTENGYWRYRLPLPAGKHYYKFIIDGKWILDPENPVKEYDGKGNINSVFMVK
ncbi:glycogen-binding domain-containing protein [uncultured Psychroserpens sp.]|uniref:glycogen-binding domain-containing protein n=1 Tax=uncultured Psychroserpens sp. TaxID=255436 RepID=UPI00260E7421|nr:glycogen-binding domain-containing protein [uncultured Psychroserpens sp.]